MSRAILLVLDGLGIGAMDDAEQRDRYANTLAHVLAQTGALLPNLIALGLTTVAEERDPVPTPRAARGSVRLAHPGADTYLGHQELMGAPVDRVSLTLLEDRRDAVTGALRQAGLAVSDFGGGLPPIVAEQRVLIADNVEALAGLSINVTASLDEITFEELLRIGKVVRKIVPTPRVIVVGGRGFSFHQVREHVRPGAQGQVGVDTPALGVYDENFRVRHLGAELDQQGQLAERAARAGQEVMLLGKAADVVACSRADRDPVDRKSVV